MNLRYDDTVHAMHNGEPTCGQAMIPACAPEETTDPITCMWCLSIVEV